MSTQAEDLDFAIRIGDDEIVPDLITKEQQDAMYAESLNRYLNGWPGDLVGNNPRKQLPSIDLS